MSRVPMIGAVVVALCPLGTAGAASGPDGPGQAPTIGLLSASVVFGDEPRGYGGRAALRIRFCARGGPRAILRIRESARHTGRVVARSFDEPLGTDFTRVQRYACVRHFVLRWLIPKRFVNGRRYSVEVRLRDGRGDVSRSVGFDFRP